jgi:hypothetical protein
MIYFKKKFLANVLIVWQHWLKILTGKISLSAIAARA